MFKLRYVREREKRRLEVIRLDVFIDGFIAVLLRADSCHLLSLISVTSLIIFIRPDSSKFLINDRGDGG